MARGQKNFTLNELRVPFEKWCASKGKDQLLVFQAGWMLLDKMDPVAREAAFEQLPGWLEHIRGINGESGGARSPEIHGQGSRRPRSTKKEERKQEKPAA